MDCVDVVCNLISSHGENVQVLLRHLTSSKFGQLLGSAPMHLLPQENVHHSCQMRIDTPLALRISYTFFLWPLYSKLLVSLIHATLMTSQGSKNCSKLITVSGEIRASYSRQSYLYVLRLTRKLNRVICVLLYLTGTCFKSRRKLCQTQREWTVSGTWHWLFQYYCRWWWIQLQGF